MQAREVLNEDKRNAGQVLGNLVDLNDIDVENQAPINHIDSFIRDSMLDKTKPFDKNLSYKSFNSHAEAYKMLTIIKC